MVSNRMTESVGKRIVDALKQQPDVEIQSSMATISTDNYSDNDDISIDNYNISDNENDYGFENIQQSNILNTPNTTFDSHVAQKNEFVSEPEEFEIPTNVAVLRQLISQLPAGVSKQTGAQIIKQTMEALGISMKSVLQEAQQVQDGLNNSSRECQATIVEYKKQINMLERQSQKLQRQYAALNDIISLFIQNV